MYIRFVHTEIVIVTQRVSYLTLLTRCNQSICAEDMLTALKGLSQSPDVVQLQVFQKLFAKRLLLEFLVHFSGQLHNIRTLGQAL